ncbi:hypothetical protein L6J37_05900 [Photobacterium sp. WH77]|uniref:VOC family protein n=1 Tax=unclassified Photobacterium TaxID=2628852 RepID=UPI001C45F4FD|nr:MULTISPECIES: hypothetical protein [unclassified Photobacterium]MBV7262507.1 hypothetical protein [Photobacterium sp. WH24]MCG2836397.1 hypothetical protein [Photobacterium sp. WH77]MCG2843976.1 hypothetical protein [Photobacterium sp. WH80]
MKAVFKPGNNIAMKIPSHEYEKTLHFYREVIAIPELAREKDTDTPRFQFGDKTLWLDNVPGISQAEIWLEIVTDDIAAAAEHLASHKIARCDEIEPLPEGFAAFWVASPSNIIHLVSQSD